MKYIKKVDNTVVEAPAKLSRDGYTIHGYNKPSNEAMLLADGYIKYTGALPLSSLDIVDGEITATPPVASMQDYDNAMEAKLRQVRHDRGYTVREPSLYINSSNPRWSQDAQDWVDYVDAMMNYGLAMQNEYITNGTIPSLDEFIAGFPEIEWSYDENPNKI